MKGKKKTQNAYFQGLPAAKSGPEIALEGPKKI